jgi:hypothetical protein
MKKIIIILLFVLNQFSFSQNFKNEKDNLVKYKSFEVHNLDSYESSWSEINILDKGYVAQNEQYFKGNLRSIQNYIYDAFGNRIYEIKNVKEKKDTIYKIKLTYNKANLMVTKEVNSNFIEKYSDFTEDGRPKLIEAFSLKGDTLTIIPFKSIIAYDKKGNLEKEILYKFSYLKDNTKKVFITEINEYKYDLFNNVIAVKRTSEPRIQYPILILGGRPQYEIENFAYKYNKFGLWTKMFWIINGKKTLIKKRKFRAKE